MKQKLTFEQEQALRRFARDNGRSWKMRLSIAWSEGRDGAEPDGCYLRQVRNYFGPSWLVRYSLPKEGGAR
jgi:hypothetical protein